MKYNFNEIEEKWQKFWDENKTFKVKTDHSKPKYYCLDFFPYPSAEGLHVGHPEGYTATDIMSRYKRMKGFNVLHPMGWDAFGLQAEQYAVKLGIHPRETISRAIINFKRQLKSIGLSYDWDREIATCDEKYYKWTQWIFLQLYKKGLAYEAEIPVNWCPELKAILANEEVPEYQEKGYSVVRKPMKQWMLKITDYAERLLNDLEELDWPESTKEMQKNWIGKSVGASVIFKIKEFNIDLEVFTTRPDTLWGATYMVLAPEHPSVDTITTLQNKNSVDEYRNSIKSKSDLERQQLQKDKTGVFTGAYAVNPVNNAEIPVWISDYVLMGYGTGVIMSVPAHDQRDYEFATKFNLPIIEVVSGGDISKSAYEEEGVAVNSDFINGLNTNEAKEKITSWLQEKELGKKAVQYKLRDWLFSRQRFWGEPIPLIHTEDGIVKPLNENELPLTLPEVPSYRPSDSGESPLANIANWVNTIDGDSGKPARRETNTMPQWAGSCWYYLRFLDPYNDKEFCSLENEKYWMPVDLYLGGAEHAVLHLLYARFWHKVLYDAGFVSTKEPFIKLYHQGMILGEDSNKMSKSRGNVVNPDDVIKSHGADSFRMFEMFMGPLAMSKPWSTKGIEGVHRFLNRVWRMFIDENGNLNPLIQDITPDKDVELIINKTIKEITEDIEDHDMKFNTSVSEMMIFTNEITDRFNKNKAVPKNVMESFVKLLSPFAPHLAEELWEKLGHNETITFEPWPDYDLSKIKRNIITVVGQINGKIKTKLEVEVDLENEKIIGIMKNDEKMKNHLEGRQIIKEVVVKNKLVNIVVK
jgi:leucyl-tRNA synthetase